MNYTTQDAILVNGIRTTPEAKFKVVVGTPGGNVLIKDQDNNTIETVPAPGEYIVTVFDGVKDTIDSNVVTILDDIL